MFDRIKYKNFAKIQLKKRWHIPILILIFTGIITLFLNLPSFMQDYKTFKQIADLPITLSDSEFQAQVLKIIGNQESGPFDSIISIGLMLIAFILEIASINVYLKMSKSPEPVKFSDFIHGFSLWGRGIIAGIWRSIFLYLWSMLLIFPAIIKWYSYRFHFYLVAEYPELSIPKALKISMKITSGFKWKLFVQDLSFLGWFIVGFISLGFGFLYVWPFYNMTITNSYHALLKEAVENGKITEDDLRG